MEASIIAKKQSKTSVEKYKFRNWLIFEDNKYKMYWDLWIMALVLYVIIVVPFRLGLMMKDSTLVIWIGVVVDLSFVVDLVLTFFTAFFAEA